VVPPYAHAQKAPLSDVRIKGITACIILPSPPIPGSPSGSQIIAGPQICKIRYPLYGAPIQKVLKHHISLKQFFSPLEMYSDITRHICTLRVVFCLYAINYSKKPRVCNVVHTVSLHMLYLYVVLLVKSSFHIYIIYLESILDSRSI
jgi:hypothetical protein